MRIVAGSARGRALRAPKSKDIRPTADRVRETVFNVLGQWLEGMRVLDLFAGTGALGLEALSRGAVQAVLVDKGKEALELCHANAETLGFSDRVRILGLPVERALGVLRKEGASFELVFADPPYAQRVVTDVLTQVLDSGVLAQAATVVVEHDRRETAPEAVGTLSRVDQRRFGDTDVSIYRTA